jgi:ketosteroid isomerase-like protein
MAGTSVELIRSLYDAFARNDQEFIAAAMDPEVEFHQTEQLPWGGHYKGFPEGVQPFFTKLRSHVDSHAAVERCWEAGDAVVVVGRTRGQARASGKSFDLPAVVIWKIRNGKIISFEPFIDTPAMLEALAA